MRPRYARTRQRLATVARATFGALLVGLVAAPVGNAATPPVRVIGSIPYLGPAAADPVARLWYESQITGSIPNQVPRIQIRNLDSLKVLRSVALPTSPNFLRTIHQPLEVNSARAQAYAVHYDGENAPHVAVIDGRTGKIAKNFAALSSVPDDSTRTIMGLGYHAKSDSLYVAWQSDMTAVANKLVSTQLNVSELNGSTGALNWTVPIQGCSAFTVKTNNIDHTGLYRSLARPEVLFSCRMMKPARTGADSGASYAVKLYLKPTGAPAVRYFAAPGNPGAETFATNSDRLFFTQGIGSQNGALVFDGRSEVFIGLVPGDIGSMGVDPRIGRLYACVTSIGLLVADAAIATPVPLGDATGLGCDAAGAPIVVDPVTRRVFTKASASGKPTVWSIIHDGSDAYVPEPEANPDAATTDIAERQGVTESTFVTTSAAYGMRMVLVGGPRGTVENLTTVIPFQAVDNTNKALIEGTHSVPGGPYSADPPNIPLANREFWFARLFDVALEADGATASGSGLDRNQYVDSDIEALSNPRVFGQQPASSLPPDARKNIAWPDEYQRQSCIALGGTTDKPKVDESDVKLTCVLGKSVEAHAFGPRHAVGVADQVTVGDATSSVTLTKDAKLGAVSTIVARAQNVAIAGHVFINDITVTAKTWAKGRPGTAGSSYDRQFSGVRIVGADGKPVYTCAPPKDCNEYEVVEQINATLGDRVRVRTPNPDPSLRGSRGGAKAVIQRNPWEHLEQQTLNGQDVNDTTMPGLEIEFVLDNLGQSRVLYQLAGMSSESVYNIYKLAQYGEFPDPPAPGTINVPSGPKIITGTGGDNGTDQPVNNISSPTTTTQTIVDKVKSGMRWAFGYNDATPLMFVTWAMFSVPVYLGVRRRLLAHTIKGGL